MARLDHLTGVLLLTLPGCLASSGGDEAASEPNDTDEATSASACAAVRLDTWFGPTLTALDARRSCVALLDDGCSALGCAADLGTIEVHGYGGESDKNWYCQGDTPDFAGEIPRYLAACRAPDVEGPAF